LREIIATAFDKEVKSLFSTNEEVRKHILNHERKNLCIDNITREIKEVEFRNAIKLDAPRIESLAKEFAKSFSKISLNYIEEKEKSDLQKRKERKDQEESDYFEQLFNDEIDEKDGSHGI
jgi:hypothetical protein